MPLRFPVFHEGTGPLLDSGAESGRTGLPSAGQSPRFKTRYAGRSPRIKMGPRPESRAPSRVCYTASMQKPIPYYRRFHGYDYSRGASLFITLSTEPRRALFGRVENATVILSDLGRAVLEAIQAIPRFNPGIALFEHVVMPDHLHMNLRIQPGLADPLQTLGAAMRRFKTYTTTLARKALGLPKLWQQGYHDRICISRRFIEAIIRYIRYNPLKYELMYNQPEFMRIREPLDSPRLDIDAFWKGMGTTSLLAPDTKLLALRISRQVAAGELPHVVSRMENAVRAGFVILSGFISPGEIAVRDMLIANREARFVHILPSCMAMRHRPDSRYLEPLAEGRFLEIAEGNDETEFGRGACLALNEEIRAMALAGEGGALYWKREGPVWVRGAEHVRGAEPAIQDNLRGAEPATQDNLRGAEPTKKDGETQ